MTTVDTWCDDCRSYTHAPWCPSYEQPEQRSKPAMVEKYYLKADHQTEWDEVTRTQFIAAEQAAGFRSKFGPNHPATGGFGGGGMRGRVEYVTEQSRPEQTGSETESETVPCGLCGTATRMKSTKRCDRCWELERRIEASPEIARKILAVKQLFILLSHDNENNDERLDLYTAQLDDNGSVDLWVRKGAIPPISIQLTVVGLKGST